MSGSADVQAPRVAIWGASGHGRVVADAARRQGLHVVAFIDDDPVKAGAPFAGAPVLGTAALSELREVGAQLHIAVGHCRARARLAELCVQQGFRLCSVLHPSAVLADDVKVGEGSFVAAGVVVNSGTQIGANVILNTSSSVDHDCGIQDGTHVAPGVRIGGLVQIGAGAFVGIGATVSNCRQIGARTIVGAGAVVVRDLPADVVAYGVPARVIRERHAHE